MSLLLRFRDFFFFPIRKTAFSPGGGGGGGEAKNETGPKPSGQSPRNARAAAVLSETETFRIVRDMRSGRR